jgi:hypothetical protein
MLRGDSTRLLNCAIALVSLCSIRRQFSCLKHPRTCKGKYTAENAEPQGTKMAHPSIAEAQTRTARSFEG